MTVKLKSQLAATPAGQPPVKLAYTNRRHIVDGIAAERSCLSYWNIQIHFRVRMIIAKEAFIIKLEVLPPV